jgi:hypothetical protein
MNHLDILAQRMPLREACHFYWLTATVVSFRTLIHTVSQIVNEGFLIARPDEFLLQRVYDDTKTMAIHFQLPKSMLDPSSVYHCPVEMIFPLHLEELTQALQCISQYDVIGLCLTKQSLLTAYPSMELFVMHPQKDYCYQYRLKLLHMEFTVSDVLQLHPEMKCTAKLTISSLQFKKYLMVCRPHGTRIRFLVEKTPLGESVLDLCPVSDTNDLTILKIRLFGLEILDESALENEEKDMELPLQFSLKKLLLFTKATLPTSHMTLLIIPYFPLVIEYTFQDLGTLQFLLAPMI